MEDTGTEQDATTESPNKKQHAGKQELDPILGRLSFSRQLSSRDDFGLEFDQIANELLNKFVLNIGGVEHRFVEIEFYFHNDVHSDVFAHRDPIQSNLGVWYFHKSGNTYRGGTYKGLDIAIGQQGGRGGILLRALEKVGDPKSLVEGPSLLVDHVLSSNKVGTIVELLDKMPENSVSKPSLLNLSVPAKSLESRTVYKSPRVGLTLKKSDSKEDRLHFLMKHYRYFTNPALKKGKHYIIPALHIAGKTAAAIAQLTGSKVDTVHKFVDLFTKGSGSAKPDSYFGKELSPEDSAFLYGALYKPSKAQS